MNLDTTQLVALAAALGWASGLRLYAVVFFTGLAGFLGWVALPSGIQVLQHPVVLAASGLMLVAEFFADKIPGVDSVWDLLQTLARVPAGAFLAAATLSPDGQLGGGTLVAGAGIALASHGLKAGTRALLNTSPEPASNWVASVAEDTVVVGGLALVMAHPWIALLVVVGASLLGALLVWWVWRTLSRGVRRLFAPPPPA